MRRFAVAVLALPLVGCSLMQPTAKMAPGADTVGAALLGGSTAVAVVYMDKSPRGYLDLTASTPYTAATCTLAGLAVVYAASAVYGFTRDPATQSDEPLIGLRMLGLGLMSMGNSLQQSSGQQGCCSYHNGISGCSGEEVICNDGTRSPTCRC